MAFLLIMLCCLLDSSEMVMRKKYTKMTLDIASSKNIYLIISGSIAVVYYFIMSKGNIRTNGITLLYALVFAAVVFLSVVIGLTAIEKTNIVNISVFSGAGSIIIFVWLFLLQGNGIGRKRIGGGFADICSLASNGEHKGKDEK